MSATAICVSERPMPVSMWTIWSSPTVIAPQGIELTLHAFGGCRAGGAEVERDHPVDLTPQRTSAASAAALPPICPAT